MGILRSELKFERDYVQIPNRWARDENLSRRARGLLVEIMSHRAGWHVTIGNLIAAGQEGRHAIRSAIDELREAGYLEVSQDRGRRGQFNEIEYRLVDPGVRKSDTGNESTGVRLSDVGSADSGESPSYKEDQPIEDQQVEDQVLLMPIEAVSFEDFWVVWPRKDAKKSASAAWARAIKRADPSRILDAAREYACHPARPEKQFVPYAATWLNGDRWDDPLPEAPPPPQTFARQRQQNALSLVGAYKEREASEEVGSGAAAGLQALDRGR